MGKKSDLSDFEHGMVVSALSRVYRDGLKKRNYSVSTSCLSENALVMPEVRGEWADWFGVTERQE